VSVAQLSRPVTIVRSKPGGDLEWNWDVADGALAIRVFTSSGIENRAPENRFPVHAFQLGPRRAWTRAWFKHKPTVGLGKRQSFATARPICMG